MELTHFVPYTNIKVVWFIWCHGNIETSSYGHIMVWGSVWHNTLSKMCEMIFSELSVSIYSIYIYMHIALILQNNVTRGHIRMMYGRHTLRYQMWLKSASKPFPD